ncbi:MAG: hypothetical protein IRY88_11680 [Rubrobacteraceae bacterium]|nr:hypothetical protein [Rubrobacteraceae bacterium]
MDVLCDLLRNPEEVMYPERLGAARPTRHSFSRSLIRYMVRHRWRVERVAWQLDAEGRGKAIYTVRTHERPLHFVVFSDVIPEEERTDRVIANAWDVTAVLCEGDLGPERLEDMRREVPRQEGGRADPRSLVWTRGNRSSRFFDHVVERLAAGKQPDPEVVGGSAYMLRSTAFYANGKFGTAPFHALGPDHPLGVSYRAQMLAAWLFREFSYDLVEHCARACNPNASRLEEGWRRYFGIGNATGLGMIAFFINHPKIINAWCMVRELALANATDTIVGPADPEVRRLLELLDRCSRFFRERDTLSTKPFKRQGELAVQLDAAKRLTEEFTEHGTMQGQKTKRPWDLLRRWATRELDVEGQELLHSLLIELYDDLDGVLEELLEVDESMVTSPQMSVGELRTILERDYAWAFEFDFEDPKSTHYFWYISANSEEPRKGVRGTDPGEEHEQPYDIARQVQMLHEDLKKVPDDDPIAVFLLSHPWHRGIAERVQSVHDLPYAEVRANYLAVDFVPLYLQKFKLAMYGMENYSPKSLDWLRVTLFQGAPRAADVAVGIEGDWIFPPKPRSREEGTC